MKTNKLKAIFMILLAVIVGLLGSFLSIYPEKLITYKTPDTDENIFKIMTYNIKFSTFEFSTPINWENRKEDVVYLMNTEPYDIIGMQEVKPREYKYIKKMLGRYNSIYRVRSNSDPEGTPIFYRKDRWLLQDSGHFWLSSTPDIPESNDFDESMPRVATWVKLINYKTNTKLFVLNTHLSLYSYARKKSSILILKKIQQYMANDPDRQIIFMGDLNTSKNSESILHLIIDGNLADTSKEYTDKFATFNFWKGSIYGEHPDHIMHSEGLVCMKYSILRYHQKANGEVLYPSDHYAVTSDFRLKSEEITL